MVACNFCRDWFHLFHVGYENLDDDNERTEEVLSTCEFFCQSCLAKPLAFVRKYGELFVPFGRDGDGKMVPEETWRDKLEEVPEEEMLVKRKRDAGRECKVAKRPEPSGQPAEGKFIYPEWRDHICYCNACFGVYRKANVEAFIIDYEQFYPTDNEERIIGPEGIQASKDTKPTTNQEPVQEESSRGKTLADLELDEFKKLDFLTQSSLANAVTNFKDAFFEFLNNRMTDGRNTCLLYTSPSPRDRQKSRMPSSA
eukprot:TRINITY_DN12604_c0_g1_i2.p1 TRINITY_DN12604_c0_g1~~TRINITY_DN12604_c0_g1_i2.p1  ORF type:complete len:255 (-),score=58.14 TRINITY_DN12604_c0_g1_i2:11-775(-)